MKKIGFKRIFTSLIAFLGEVLRFPTPVIKEGPKNNNDVVIFRKDGSMQLNYKNESVKKNISEQIKKFSEIKFEQSSKSASYKG